jgi:hypothetical protein
VEAGIGRVIEAETKILLIEDNPADAALIRVQMISFFDSIFFCERKTQEDAGGRLQTQ